MTTTIIRNSARCKSCGDHIESKDRNNFIECSCGSIFVDGGSAYIRHGYNNPKDYVDTSITMNRPE
jgi:hypothetical protein